MNLPGPTRVFELTYLAEFHGVGKWQHMRFSLLSCSWSFVMVHIYCQMQCEILLSFMTKSLMLNVYILKKMTWTITVYVAFGSIILGTTSVSGYWTSVPRPILWGPCLDSEAVDHWPPEMTISCGLSRSRRAGRIVSRSWRIRNRWGACIHVHACAIYIYSLDYFGLSLIVIHSIWWGCAGDMHIYIYMTEVPIPLCKCIFVCIYIYIYNTLEFILSHDMGKQWVHEL